MPSAMVREVSTSGHVDGCGGCSPGGLPSRLSTKDTHLVDRGLPGVSAGAWLCFVWCGADPVDNFGDVVAGLPVELELVVAGCDRPELLAAVESPLDLVTTFVPVGIERWGPATGGSLA